MLGADFPEVRWPTSGEIDIMGHSTIPEDPEEIKKTF